MTAITNHSDSGTSAIDDDALRPPVIDAFLGRAEPDRPAERRSHRGDRHRCFRHVTVPSRRYAGDPGDRRSEPRSPIEHGPAAEYRRCAGRGRCRYPSTDAGCRCTDGRTARRSSRTAATGRSSEPRNPCAASNASGPFAAATSHHTSRIVPTVSATPVTRCRIDSTEVSCQR